jgi:hypothetical protein
MALTAGAFHHTRGCCTDTLNTSKKVASCAIFTLPWGARCATISLFEAMRARYGDPKENSRSHRDPHAQGFANPGADWLYIARRSTLDLRTACLGRAHEAVAALIPRVIKSLRIGYLYYYSRILSKWKQT